MLQRNRTSAYWGASAALSALSALPFLTHNGPTYPARVATHHLLGACYGPDILDPYRRSASYVDRIMRGEKPSDLPFQHATKFKLVINLKTAKALGLNDPVHAVRPCR